MLVRNKPSAAPGNEGAALGALVAAILFQAWRASPPALESSGEELSRVTPFLLWSGAGALGWRRVRNSDLSTSPAAQELQQAYRLHVLQAGLHERHIKTVVTRLRSAGVEPLLVKGWAVAQLYPEKGLRPYGDIDLCVRPEQYVLANALPLCEERECKVDLHRGFRSLNRRTPDEVLTRSRLVRLGDMDIRVPGPEDHLRLLCWHLLRHGAWRPLWLCDIGLAVESRPSDFDWDYCYGKDRRRADWVSCAIGLAHQLLGANVDDTPAAWRARNLPSWLVPAVLRQWATPPRFDVPIVPAFIHHPVDGVREMLSYRWRNPIAATVALGGPFNELPRPAFQLAQYLWEGAKFIGRLPTAVRKLRRRNAGRGAPAERGV